MRITCYNILAFLTSLFLIPGDLYPLRALQAMQFPPSSRKDEADAEEKRRERQQAEQELAQHIAEEGDDDY